MPARPFTWRFLLRRGWLLTAGACLGLVIAWVISGLTISATSAFAVQTVGYYQPPYESNHLALTYARLLPEEPEIVDEVSAAVGRPPSYVSDHLSMQAVPETNLLIARYSGESSGEAKAGLEAFDAALPKASDLGGTQLRESVRTLTEPGVHGGMSRKKALALGLIAGFSIALALALVLERRRPRLDDWRDLARIVELPIVVAGEPPGEDDGVLVVRAGAAAEDVVETHGEMTATGRAVREAWFVKTPLLPRRSQRPAGTADVV